MKKLLPALLAIQGVFIQVENVNGQSSSLHDSLRHLLARIEEKATDENLRKVVKDAKALYITNLVEDSLSKKLLIADSLLVNDPKSDRTVSLSYAETLVKLFEGLSPKKEHRYYAGSLNNLGVLYYNTGKYDKALLLYQQSLAIRKKVLGEEHPEYAGSLNNLVVLYSYKGEYEKALPLCQQALAIRQKVLGEEHPAYAESLNNLAVLYFHIGQYDKAMPLHQQSLAIRKRVLGEEHGGYAESLNNLAILYMYMGQYEEALPLYLQALPIRKKVLGEEHPDYAYSLNAFAALYYYMGQYEKVLPLYRNALTIKKKIFGEEHPEYAGTLNNLALLYYSMGQYDKALPLYQQGVAIYKKFLGREHPEYANTLINLADLYKDMGQYDKALLLYRETLAARKKVLGEEHPAYTESLNNLADLYKKMGQYKKALSFNIQALAIRKKVLGEEHPDYASSVSKLATLYHDSGQYDKALPLYQQAIAIRKKVLGKEHPDYANDIVQLGLLYSVLGKFTNAVSLFTEASHSTLSHLNQTYATLSEQEKIKLSKLNESRFAYLPSLLATRRVNQPALVNQLFVNELALKGMVLEDQQEIFNSIRKSGDSAFLQLYEQWRLNKALLGNQLLLPRAKRLPALDSLEEVTNQMEQHLSRGSHSFRNLKFRQSITAKDIVRKLQKGEAAVEFMSFKLYNKKWTDSTLYAALVLLPGDTTPRFIRLFEEKQLQKLLRSFSKRIDVAAAVDKLYVEDTLYKLIWQPLEKSLAGVHTVYYAPAGLLHRIAFQALGADSSNLLIDKYQLNQVLSTRSLAVQSDVTKKPVSAGIWGNIRYGLQTEDIASFSSATSRAGMDTSASSFNFYTSDTRKARGDEFDALPGTKLEMERITKELHQKGTITDIDSGLVATEEAFKALDGKSPQVLHLATHGFFLPVTEIKPNDNPGTGDNVFTVQQNPMFRSGIVLAGGNYTWKGGVAIPGKEDGILTAYEIAQMDLSNTDLVVLSACETALGDLQGNEGAIGLQRAFKMAGVKQMIISLWPVPDKQTAELMATFYHNWLSGQSTREALRSAQLKMKEKYLPYFWAAFVVVE